MLAKLFAPPIVKILAGLSALLLVALAVQTIRANHYRDKSEACEAGRKADRAAYAAAQVQAKAAQDALNSSISARYRAISEETDRDHQKALEDARSATDRYIAAHRVRPQAGGAPGSASAPAPGDRPDLPDDPTAETELVAVKSEDVHSCAADYAYARGAFDFVQGLVVDGLAVPAAVPDPAFGQ